MVNSRLPRIIFTLLFIIAIAMPLFYINQLPERVAIHFDLSNRADGWMSKTSYLLFHYSIVIFFYITFRVLCLLLPKFPSSLINLPRKDYWLHESRKEETFKTLQAMILWIGNLCIALFIYVFYEILKANTNKSLQISSFSWLSVILFLSGTAAVVIKYIMRFTKKENQLEEQ
ncbi:MAG: hypothetical protein FD143_2656 [Ignavibacteria bacterium]|nr:MAG: hypothetical protein FD143_2656 [Ignavibacteria bacterium]KAF0156124.1 MAG: hypothetical protein FD188_3015 [Ignavibacteria bacterium]